MAVDEITAERYQTITAWQNVIDLTAFLKTQTGNFGLLLARKDANNSNKIFTSEATGITNEKCSFFNSCTAADLVPQLTVVFRKSGDPSGIDSVDTSVANADKSIYTLSGQRVEKMGKGLYIVGGRKVLVK